MRSRWFRPGSAQIQQLEAQLPQSEQVQLMLVRVLEEMGAYHHLYLVASREAVIIKLKEFLPTGIRPVVIPDHSLHQLPGELTIAETE